MKIIIERGQLLKVLTHIQSIVERRNTIPILSNVKFDAADGQLGLNATDMDLDIVETIPAEVASPGSTTAPAHTLFDIVRKLPEGAQVELESSGDDGQLSILAGRSRFTLTCLPTEDFPVLSGGDLQHSFSVSAADLRNLVDRTRFAISTEETRYYLNGIYLHTANTDGVSVLRSVATDGHRLASVDIPLPDGAAGMPGVIVPRKTVTELRKLIEDVDGDVALSLSDTKIRFAFDNAVLTSKLIDGTFPDYDRVIPSDNDKVLEVDAKMLAEAVDRVSAISTEKSRAVKLSLSSGSLTLSASSPDNDTAVEELAVQYDAGDLEIGFNSRYLLDITQQIDGGSAKLVLSDAASPTLVQDTGDSSALYVLMPMRV
ncbi:MAG: DNA polymerase III subunit beta [Rhodospirillales bacterium]|nr:DNA polymerase III subunit beta [Rhodospirillales bacterium]